MKSKLITSIMLAGVFFLPAGYANTLNCVLSNTFPGETAVVNIAGTISVGDSVQNGTVLYKASYRTGISSGVRCTSEEIWPSSSDKIDIPYIIDAAITPLPEVPKIRDPNGSVIYKTNVEGIGVSFSHEDNHKLPYNGFLRILPENEGNSSGFVNVGNSMNVTVRLIKTGVFNSGAVDGIAFPTITVVFNNPTGSPQHTFNGFPIQSNKLSFSGQVQVVKSTCRIVTSNITVPLGKYDVSEFRGKGSFTDWKDATISLNGCASPIPGYYSNNNKSIEIKGSGTFPTGMKDVNNRVTLRVYPNEGFIDPTKGIIWLNQSENKAEGIGVQIGYGDSGTVKPLILDIDKELTPPVNGATTMNVPLFARYIQTEDSVTVGEANAALTYFIIYY